MPTKALPKRSPVGGSRIVSAVREDDRCSPTFRLVDLWNDLAGITAKSSDGSAESLKQLMYDSLTVAFFASRLYERVRFELRTRRAQGWVASPHHRLYAAGL
ncbi:MAG: hypothetical protein ACLR3C_07025 [Eggerthella lenta]